MDVADTLQKHVNEAYSRSVLHVTDRQRQLNVVHRECVQQDEEVSKRFVLGQEHHTFVHVHKFLDHFYAWLFNEETRSQVAEQFAGVPEQWQDILFLNGAVHLLELLLRMN